MTVPTSLRNISIIGNISSGKSTLAHLLGKAISNSVAIPEDFSQNPFLEQYVQQPARWGFTNAVRYFYDYVRIYHELTDGQMFEHYFIDAGGSTNRHVYGRYLLEEKIITPQENEFYQVLCEIMQRAYAYPEPDAYIFLRASPAKCFARMKQRGWKYQTENIALKYLAALQKYIAAFQNVVQQSQLPYLELDSDALDFTAAKDQAMVITQVRTFLATSGA
ncbi:MAG: hypothetical protein EYC68_01835 [Chloroflexota bacterium]|nr:MAG: hypothetical protein EYC68_01835 [Chloroflexota bacterium]